MLGTIPVMHAQFDQYSVGSLGKELVASDNTISMIQSMGDLGTVEQETNLFSPGFPQCWNEDCNLCQNVVSTIQLDKGGQISLFPNPTPDILNVKLQGATMLQYKVVNVSGQLLQRGICSGEITLDLTSFPKGIYFIQFWDQEQRLSHAAKVIRL